MATTGRTKSWKDHFQKKLCIPVAWDRRTTEDGSDSNPFRLCIKTMDGTLSNVSKLKLILIS